MADDRIDSFERDGLRFDVRDEGPPGGPPVVLLHGFPQTSSSWDRVAPLLHAAGLRTLAPDQRGYSPEARPPGRRAYRMGELVRDVAALVERVGQPVHLVGHDWGAAAAWATAIARPDLLRTLTTVSVPHPGAFLATMRQGQALHSWYMAFFNVPLLPELALGNRAVASRVLRGSGMSPEVFDRYWREFADGGALRGGLGWYRALPFGDRRLFAQRVHVPTTHVWSDLDGFLVRAGAERCGEYVEADYRLVVLDGVSHWIPDEVPDQLARVVLDRVLPVDG